MASSDRQLRRTVVVIMLGTMLSTLDMTVVNVALDRLGRDLHSSIANVQWVVTAYLLALAAVMPVSGWASRRFGARRVFIWSLALFTAGSALCALADSTLALVSCRVLQGAAGGMILPTSQLIGAEVAGVKRMGPVMSRVWMVTSIGAVLGPVLGGAILDSLGWRWIFLINVPVGAAAVLGAVLLLPETPRRTAGRFDLGGFARLSLGLPALMFGLSLAATHGHFTSISVIAPLALGLALLTAFVQHALRRERPLLDVRLYAHRAFAAGSLSLACLNVAWFGALILLPLYLQQLRHDSAALTGLLLAPQGLGTAIGMWFVGRVNDRSSSIRIGIAGVLLFAIGTVPLAFAGPHTSYVLICAGALFEGFGGGVAWVPAIAAAYGGLRPEEISDGTPLVSVITRIGASVGTAAAAIVLQQTLVHLGRPRTAAHLSVAYDITFWVVIGMTAATLVPYSFLIGSRRRSRWQPEPELALPTA
jgi:EmrB/QacA subfamily drug resistance transporter